MSPAEEFKKTYDDIRLLGVQANNLFSAASNHIKTGIDVLAKEFDYSFVVDKPLRDRLKDSCERMLLARTGFLHPDADVAFEDLSRNIHLQLEGLSNCWFNQWFLTKNNLSEFPVMYVSVKLEQQLSLQFQNNIPVSKVDIFNNELAKISLFPIDFINDYLSLDYDDVLRKYRQVFIASAVSFEDLKKIRKPPNYANQTVEKLDFSYKAEYIYLIEKGIKFFFTNHTIVRLNEFRNALIAHMGAGMSQTAPYYKELVSKVERQDILVKAFVSFYETVKRRLE